MTKFSNKFKKPCFWPIFGAKNIFLENPALSRITSYWFLAPCQNLEKFNDTIQRKRLDRQTEGQKDGQKIKIISQPFVNIKIFSKLFLNTNAVSDQNLGSYDIPFLRNCTE